MVQAKEQVMMVVNIGKTRRKKKTLQFIVLDVNFDIEDRRWRVKTQSVPTISFRAAVLPNKTLESF